MTCRDSGFGFLAALGTFLTGIYLFVIFWGFCLLFCAEHCGFNLDRKAFVSYVLLSKSFDARTMLELVSIAWKPDWRLMKLFLAEICVEDQIPDTS
ncbi:hypothetical protein Tco_0309736 [Tanacetum coccineum]